MFYNGIFVNKEELKELETFLKNQNVKYEISSSDDTQYPYDVYMKDMSKKKSIVVSEFIDQQYC